MIRFKHNLWNAWTYTCSWVAMTWICIAMLVFPIMEKNSTKSYALAVALLVISLAFLYWYLKELSLLLSMRLKYVKIGDRVYLASGKYAEVVKIDKPYGGKKGFFTVYPWMRGGEPMSYFMHNGENVHYSYMTPAICIIPKTGKYSKKVYNE